MSCDFRTQRHIPWQTTTPSGGKLMTDFTAFIERIQKRQLTIIRPGKNGKVTIKIFHMITKSCFAGVATFKWRGIHLISLNIQVENNTNFIRSELAKISLDLAPHLERDTIIIDGQNQVNTSATVLQMYTRHLIRSVQATNTQFAGEYVNHTWTIQTRKSMRIR